MSYAVLSSEEASRRVAEWKLARIPKPLERPPGPEVTARPALVSEVPRSAATLAKNAGKAGWRVRVTYARGPYVLANGKYTGRTVESVAVRLRHPDGRAAVAVWLDGKTECAFTWTVTESGLVHMPRKCNVTEVKAFIVWSGSNGQEVPKDAEAAVS